MTNPTQREMQLFLLGFIIIEICEIFTVGGFPLDGNVRKGFTAVHIATVAATAWVLMLNGIVGYQLIEDGTPMSLGLVVFSAAILFIGTGYIALDTGFSWTGFWDSTLVAPNRSYSLYTLYFLAPLVFICIFFLLETYLVLRILGEKRPMGTFAFHIPNRGRRLTFGSQYTSLVPDSFSPSAKSSSSSSAYTSATARTARSMEGSLKHYSPYLPLA